MTLKNAVKKITENFVIEKTSGKIKLQLSIFDYEEDGYFSLIPCGLEHDDVETSFEEVMRYLLDLVGYSSISYEDREELLSYYDKYWYTNTTLIPFLVTLYDDFYLDHEKNCKIDFEVSECTHVWDDYKELDPIQITRLINYYNSKSKYFEIVTTKVYDE